MCVDPYRQSFEPQTGLCGVVLNESASPARTKKEVVGPVINPATFLIYLGTVLEVKWCVSGENGQISRGGGEGGGGQGLKMQHV